MTNDTKLGLLLTASLGLTALGLVGLAAGTHPLYDGTRGSLGRLAALMFGLALLALFSTWRASRR